jgi:membrane-associated phospholipid phosphatase
VGSLLPGWRWVVLPLAGGVAYSRVYLGVHYPADVLVGGVWGAGLGYGLALLAKRVVPADWMAVEASTRKSPTLGTDPPDRS